MLDDGSIGVPTVLLFDVPVAAIIAARLLSYAKQASKTEMTSMPSTSSRSTIGESGSRSCEVIATIALMIIDSSYRPESATPTRR